MGTMVEMICPLTYCGLTASMNTESLHVDVDSDMTFGMTCSAGHRFTITMHPGDDDG